MRFSIGYDGPGKPGSSEPVTVGWLLMTDKGGVIYGPPEPLSGADGAVGYSAGEPESRYFLVRCPFDLKLAFERDKDGRPFLRNLLGARSPVRRSKLDGLIHLVGEDEWRHPDRPTVQMVLPYLFIADEPVYLSQVSPFLHHLREPWPGTIFGGRFPIDVWPRQMMWAIEWHDTKRPLQLTRGDPLFYCMFESERADRPIRLVEAARTEELMAYIAFTSGAVNYVNQTFSLFKAAAARRPKKLLKPVRD